MRQIFRFGFFVCVIKAVLFFSFIHYPISLALFRNSAILYNPHTASSFFPYNYLPLFIKSNISYHINLRRMKVFRIYLFIILIHSQFFIFMFLNFIMLFNLVINSYLNYLYYIIVNLFKITFITSQYFKFKSICSSSYFFLLFLIIVNI